jgi:anti-sigma B factor antagonist
MSQGSAEPFLVKDVKGIIVLTFNQPKISSELAPDLYGLVEGQEHPRLVLNFEQIRFLSSAPIGVLVNLRQKAEATGGSVSLCRLDPDIREILRLTSVESLFRIYDSEQDAIDSFDVPDRPR